MSGHPIESHQPKERERYSLKADRFSSHWQIADWLKRYQSRLLPSRPCVVYDIGCAQGILGQLLDPADFALYGVDSNLAAVEQARSTYVEAIHADIESQPTFTFAEPPDVMVLADVLEHTREPALCLDRLCRAFLPHRGRVIISVPNVAHLYVRLSLLIGHFDYAERGILDRTHLRFFTLDTALELVRACGIAIDRVAATPVPLPLLSPIFEEGRPLWPLHRLQAALSQLFKTLLGYQVIVYGIYTG
jgi:2-polyprenyl-3-methyl-5-hydroxy-6-metoxy-1,4-benzoquinol methylase